MKTSFDEATLTSCPELQSAIARLTRSGQVCIQLVSDYLAGDPAVTKMATSVCKHFGVSSCRFLPAVSVEPLNTLQGSFRCAMLALAPHKLLPEETLFYLNVAPISSQNERNGHHPFCAAVLSNGRVVFSPLAGYSLSALKPWISHLYVLSCEQEGVQFRSWYCFPESLGKICSGEWSLVEQEIDLNEVPDMPEELVVDYDNFGNLRTFKKPHDIGLTPGDECLLLRDGIAVGKALFGDPLPEKLGRYNNHWLSIKAGSNITQADPDSAEIPHLDIFRVKGNASQCLVMDITRFSQTPFGALVEAYSVAERAFRVSGLGEALRGLYQVLCLRIGEWKQSVGTYERAKPKLSIKRMSASK